MVECARHVNLVRVHIEPSDSDILVTHILNDCDARQRSLLKQLINVLEADKLAKLAYANVCFFRFLFLSSLSSPLLLFPHPLPPSPQSLLPPPLQAIPSPSLLCPPLLCLKKKLFLIFCLIRFHTSQSSGGSPRISQQENFAKFLPTFSG